MSTSKFSLLNAIKSNKKKGLTRIAFHSETFKIYFEVLLAGKKKMYNVVQCCLLCTYQKISK